MKSSVVFLGTRNDWFALRDLVSIVKPNISVEIGSWLGGSAQIIAEHSRRLFCVDTWAGTAGDFDKGLGAPGAELSQRDLFCEFCKAMGKDLFTKVFPCAGCSKIWSDVWTIPIDFLYIDGDHSYEGVREDILSWLPHVRNGGTIAGHDSTEYVQGIEGIPHFPGVVRAVDEIFPSREVVDRSSVWVVRKN